MEEEKKNVTKESEEKLPSIVESTPSSLCSSTSSPSSSSTSLTVVSPSHQHDDAVIVIDSDEEDTTRKQRDDSNSLLVTETTTTTTIVIKNEGTKTIDEEKTQLLTPQVQVVATSTTTLVKKEEKKQDDDFFYMDNGVSDEDLIWLMEQHESGALSSSNNNCSPKPSNNTIDTFFRRPNYASPPSSLSRSMSSPTTSTTNKRRLSNASYSSPSSSSTPSPSQSPSQRSHNYKRPRSSPQTDAIRNSTTIQAPPWKRVPNTNFIIDGFKYKGAACKSYFLTHFHADHYGGITSGFNYGLIYCSEITAGLVAHKLGVKEDKLFPLPMYTEVEVENAKVTLLEANHCPGAVLFLFNVNGVYYLHTGDFRYHPKLKSCNSILSNIKIQELYLDTTFCNPEYCFPPQEESISSVVNIVKKEYNKETLFLFGTYCIGKERVLMEVSRTFRTPVYVSTQKYELIKIMKLDLSLFTTNAAITQFHAVPMFDISYKKLQTLKACVQQKYKTIVGFQPTGWAQQTSKPMGRGVKVYSVPYSEHSSFNELQEFVDWIKPLKITPTVNCTSQKHVKEMITNLLNYKKPPSFASKVTSYLPCFSNLFTSSSSTSSQPIENDDDLLGSDDEKQVDFDGSNFEPSDSQDFLDAFNDFEAEKVDNSFVEEQKAIMKSIELRNSQDTSRGATRTPLTRSLSDSAAIQKEKRQSTAVNRSTPKTTTKATSTPTNTTTSNPLQKTILSFFQLIRK
eukprot:TRINITY_DN9835_c0_g1_i1.p1 TRINITY_DN9835_c0_g1~~TRINITY_DN9835_c0_g1_i1.p1  ORF type:complete len:736 (-),score=195.15 TRINITY_DN9835_c0_g1_i1:8-2215(-)